MKGFFIGLETLTGGKMRVTGRVEGRAVCYIEGDDARELVIKALGETCPAHRISGDKFSMEYIRMNDAARIAYS